MPALKITISAAKTLGELERLLGRLEASGEPPVPPLKLQQALLERAAFDTVGLAGNSFSFQQATAVLRGKPLLASGRETLELENAYAAHQRLGTWDPLRKGDLLEAHGVLLDGLSADAGQARSRQDALQAQLRLLGRGSELPPIVAAITFHRELLRIRPFSDGNGRIARLWQRALLRRASVVFEHAPVDSLIREHEEAYEAASKDDDRFLEYGLDMLLQAMQRLAGQLRGRAETADDRAGKARKALAKSWFSRKDYLALFPRLSTASASRDLARALADGSVTTRGAHALTEYRFR